MDNRTLGQLFINLIYTPLKNVELGGELIYGKRKTIDGDTGTMSRLDLMGRYSDTQAPDVCSARFAHTKRPSRSIT